MDEEDVNSINYALMPLYKPGTGTSFSKTLPLYGWQQYRLSSHTITFNILDPDKKHCLSTNTFPEKNVSHHNKIAWKIKSIGKANNKIVLNFTSWRNYLPNAGTHSSSTRASKFSIFVNKLSYKSRSLSRTLFSKFSIFAIRFCRKHKVWNRRKNKSTGLFKPDKCLQKTTCVYHSVRFSFASSELQCTACHTSSYMFVRKPWLCIVKHLHESFIRNRCDSVY